MMAWGWNLYAHLLADAQAGIFLGVVAHCLLPRWGMR